MYYYTPIVVKGTDNQHVVTLVMIIILMKISTSNTKKSKGHACPIDNFNKNDLFITNLIII